MKSPILATFCLMLIVRVTAWLLDNRRSCPNAKIYCMSGLHISQVTLGASRYSRPSVTLASVMRSPTCRQNKCHHQ